MAAGGADDIIEELERERFDLSEIRDDLALVPHGGNLNAWQGRTLPSLFMNANAIVQGLVQGVQGNVQKGIQDIVVLNCATMENTVSLMRHLKAWSQQTTEEKYERQIQELQDTIQARELRLRELEATLREVVEIEKYIKLRESS